MERSRGNPDGERAARNLLDYLSRPDYRPMPQRELLHRANVPRDERAAARRLIRRLIVEGRIRKTTGGRLVAAHARVEAGRACGPVGEPPRSPGREVLGVWLSRGRAGWVQPFDAAAGGPIRVSAALRADTTDLQVVRVEVLRPPGVGRPAEGRILERLGTLDEPGTDVKVVSHKYDLSTEFPADVLRQADGLSARAAGAQAGEREVFDDPPALTIDGETAQDFDDAVSVQELRRGGFRLFVHIADVSHFVAGGSALDLEARRRGTSVYFPGRVLPMLPEVLSNDLCSLKPAEARLVQTVILDFTARGEPKGVRFADGIIHSAARLTYTQVAAVLAGKRRGHGVPLRLLPMLEVADRLRAVLEGVRSARGSIDFDLPEPQILLDVEGAMTGITIQSRNVAHRMVEAFMIAANEAVATHLGRQRIPSLFRVHDPPDPAKLDALAKFVSGFGLRLDVAAAQRDGPAPIQQMLRQVQDRQEAAVVGQVTLRSMSRARYDVENAGHFGLASESYCHFTSPIRRYPDLVVHRSLRRSRGARPAGAVPDVGALRSIAETSSETERRAEAAERELLAWKKVAFIERRIGDSFDGLVTGVTRFGLFVQLIDNLVEGLVRAEALGEEWFEFLPQRFELCGTRSGRTFRLGDRLRVRVDRADRVLQRVDLSLAEGPEGSAGSPPPRRRRAAARRCARPGGGSRPRVRRR